ncbi:MAG: hypothetical protein KF729_16070 [Sandaracinaceae bacterium]|nr:hypothetical protein [Sandaracinaceae bacterium]
MRPLALVLVLGSLTVACGANDASTASSATSRPEPRAAEPAPAPQSATSPEPAQSPEPEPEPEPARTTSRQPVELEAGARLGPIRIGMSEADVRALGLAETRVDPRTVAFGPYHVTFRAGAVRRVEAEIGALAAIRFDGRVLEAGTHIGAIRDAFGDCTWTEGGGERYVCAGGTLSIRTTHTMDPQRYTIGVEGR